MDVKSAMERLVSDKVYTAIDKYVKTVDPEGAKHVSLPSIVERSLRSDPLMGTITCTLKDLDEVDDMFAFADIMRNEFASERMRVTLGEIHQPRLDQIEKVLTIHLPKTEKPKLLPETKQSGYCSICCCCTMFLIAAAAPCVAFVVIAIQNRDLYNHYFAS